MNELVVLLTGARVVSIENVDEGCVRIVIVSRRKRRTIELRATESFGTNELRAAIIGRRRVRVVEETREELF